MAIKTEEIARVPAERVGQQLWVELRPSLREHGARRTRDDAEIEKQKTKARELRSTPNAGAKASGAAAKAAAK